MKIALVTGSYPPETCGIGDYTCQLAKALSGQGLDVEVVKRRNWSIGQTAGIIGSIKALGPDIVHIQYPTAGFGWHLTPHILSLLMPAVITLHEVTEAHILRKLSLYPFTLRSRQVIFTTPYEREFALKRAPWIADRSSVIPIGSNITIGPANRSRALSEIVYFGLFRPNKGIEQVLSLAALVMEQNLDYRIRMIGKPFPKDSPFYGELQERSRNLPVLWNADLDDTAVAELLSTAAFAYMPFPDGASGRRGSLLALLANGVATVTTKGAHTQASLDEAVLYSRTPEQALSLIQQLRCNDSGREQLSGKARTYASQFDWDVIARKHREIYVALAAATR